MRKGEREESSPLQKPPKRRVQKESTPSSATVGGISQPSHPKRSAGRKGLPIPLPRPLLPVQPGGGGGSNCRGKVRLSEDGREKLKSGGGE